MISIPVYSSLHVVTADISDYHPRSLRRTRRLGQKITGLLKTVSDKGTRQSGALSEAAASASIESSINDSIAECETSSSSPSIFGVPSMKSILKTEKPTTATTKRSILQKRKVVCFRSKSMVTIHNVDSFAVYSTDVWWSKEEIVNNKRAQTDLTNELIEWQCIAKDYLQAIKNGRDKLMNDKTEFVKKIENSNIVSTFDELYKQLAAGRSAGCAGLEVYTDDYVVSRIRERHTVSKIVQYYNYLYQSGMKWSDVDKKVSLYAQSLSLPSIQWAKVLGIVDQDVANYVYQKVF